jgi:hypothetical protein
MNADDLVRAKCRARDDYYRHQGAIQAKMEQLTAENTQITAQYKEATAKAEQEFARAEQLSSKVELLTKILSENGIPIPKDEQ